MVGMLRTPSPGSSVSGALGNWSEEAGREIRLHTSLQQRDEVLTSKVRYQVKEFSILPVGRCKPLDLLNSFLSYAPQQSGASPVSLFILLLAFPQVLCNHKWHPLNQFWEHSFIFGEITDGCDISHLLIWQEIFSLHMLNVTVFGNGTFKKANEVKRDREGGTWG